MPVLLSELKHALRGLFKTPGFTAVAIIALALGIGANTAIFSVINGVLLRPLPYREPSQLIHIDETAPDMDGLSIAYPNFLDWQRENRTLAEIAAFRWESYNITSADRPENVDGRMVTADFFRVLGIAPWMGRDFDPREDRLGAAPVAIISGGLWKRRFGGSPGVLGQRLPLGGQDYTVVGVTPEDFQIFGKADIYTLLGQWQDLPLRTREEHPGITAVGRLKPGVTIAQAHADLNAIAAHLAEAYPATNAKHGIRTNLLARDIAGNVQQTLFVLLGAVAFVLLIACANVANLLLARSAQRRKELAIRIAMGASRFEIARYLFGESLLLALAGGLAGLTIAKWGTQAILAMVPGGLPRMENIGIDVWVLGFTLLISVVTGLVFGMLPALQASSADLTETLKEGARGSTSGRPRVRTVLVVSEVAGALVLLVGAGLMLRTIWLLNRADPGFNTHGLLTFSMSLSPANTANSERITQTLRQLEDRLNSVPGVTHASVTSLIPLSPSDNELPFYVNGRPKPASQADMSWALLYATGPGYRETMGIPLLRGRYFTEQDIKQGARVVLIDEEMARTVFPNQDPIGQSICVPDMSGILDPEVLKPMPIVGVVGHVKHWGLAKDASAKIRSELYMPLAQIPGPFLKLVAGLSTYVVRSNADPAVILPGVRQAVAAAGNNEPIFNVETVDHMLYNAIADRRFSMLLLSIFAGVALLLAAVGIYGVVSYTVAQQRQEIGIRMALGAQRQDVLRAVVARGMMPVLIGLGIGLAAAFVLSRLMTRMLYGVQPSDPLTFAGVAVTLAVLALAANLVPAVRATRIDPMEALRCA